MNISVLPILHVVIFNVANIIAPGILMPPGRRRAILIQSVLHIDIAILTIGIVLLKLLLTNLLTVVLPRLHLHFSFVLLFVDILILEGLI